MANSQTVVEALGRIENIKTSIKTKLINLGVKTSIDGSFLKLIPQNANLELINQFIQSIEKREEAGKTYLISSAKKFNKGYYPEDFLVEINGGDINSQISKLLEKLADPDNTITGQITYTKDGEKWVLSEGTVGSNTNKLVPDSSINSTLVLHPENSLDIKLKTDITYHTNPIDVYVDVSEVTGENYLTSNTIPEGYYPNGVDVNIIINNDARNNVVNVVNSKTPITITSKETIITPDLVDEKFDFIKELPIEVQDASIQVNSEVKGKISITATLEGWFSTAHYENGQLVPSLEIDASDFLDTLIDAQDLNIDYDDFSEISEKTNLAISGNYYKNVNIDTTTLINKLDNF